MENAVVHILMETVWNVWLPPEALKLHRQIFVIIEWNWPGAWRYLHLHLSIKLEWLGCNEPQASKWSWRTLMNTQNSVESGFEWKEDAIGS